MGTIHNRRHPLRVRALAAAAFAALAPQAFAGTYTWDIGNLSDAIAAGLPDPLAVTDTLNIGAGNYKYVNTGLTTQGTVNWLDTLYFVNGNTISNSGSWTAVGNAGFADGGYSGSFVNSGLFDGGAFQVAIGNIAFTNSGTVNADSGGSVSFNSNGSTFNAGTQFTGAGVVNVNGNTSFNGSFTSQNLQLVSGTFTGSAAQINGAVGWSTGYLAGTWSVASGQTLNLRSGNYKFLNGTLANAGTMNAQDNLYFQNGNALTNQGLYDLQADVGTADGAYSGTFTNNAILRKSAGAGTSNIQGITFINNGEVNAQTGTIAFNSGTYRFNDGTKFTGAGQVVVSTNATFVGGFTTAGNLTLSAGSYFGGDGNPGSKATMNGDANWVTGALTGTWEIASGQTLALLPGNYKYVNGAVTNKGTIAAQDNLYFQNGNALTNQGLYDLQADVGTADGAYSGTFTNNAILRKSAGAGTSNIQGITFINNGEINAQTGTIAFNSGSYRFNDGTKFTGAAQVAVSTNATFVGGFTTAGNLTLSAGSYSGGDGNPGSKATMNGNVKWTTGSLTGTWEIASGQTLALLPGNYKYVNGAVTNKGTMAAQDNLQFQNGNTLTNQGRYELQGDVGFVDGGYNGSFVNTGLVIKSAGTGTSNVAAIDFVNAAGGTVDPGAGTIQLPNNFTNQGTLLGVGAFSTNLLTNAGHVAPGQMAGHVPGTLTVNGNFAQAAAGSFDAALGGGAGASLLAVSGNLSLDGALNLICYGACTYTVGQTITIMTYDGTLTGIFAGSPVLSGFASGAFDVSYIMPHQVLLTVTQNTIAAVPEPSTWALLLAGLAAVGVAARRRRR